MDKTTLSQLMYITIGSIGLVGNVIIILVGITNKSMRTQTYHFPYLLAVCESARCMATLLAGMWRLAAHLTGQGAIPYWYCASVPFTNLFAVTSPAIAFTNLCICIDRLIAISAPMYYFKSMPINHTVKAAIVVGVLSIGEWVALSVYSINRYWSTDRLVTPFCTPTDAFDPPGFVMLQSISSAVNAVIVVLVIAMLILVKCKTKTTNEKNGGNVQDIARARDNRVTRMLMYVLVVSVFLGCLPEVGVAVVLHLKKELHLLQTFTIMLNLNSMNNIGFYVWKNRDIRNAVKKLLGWKSEGGQSVTSGRMI